MVLKRDVLRWRALLDEELAFARATTNNHLASLLGFCTWVQAQRPDLFAMGFVPYLDTYPGSYVPIPWYLAQHYGSTSPKKLFQEVLTLTKMNVNNCSFADGTPITLSFAQMIGEIMKHVPDGENIQQTYQFYM